MLANSCNMAHILREGAPRGMFLEGKGSKILLESKENSWAGAPARWWHIACYDPERSPRPGKGCMRPESGKTADLEQT